MPETQAFRRYTRATQKWRDLVEKRTAYFIELHISGRWKHYYNRARFLSLLLEAVDLAERWAQMVPRPDEAAPAAPSPTPDTSARSAA
jgi:hypothetical protein